MHISPLIVVMAIWGLSGAHDNFQPYFSIAGVLFLGLGLCGILYISFISKEPFYLSISKLLVLTALWASPIFGGAFLIYSFGHKQWVNYVAASALCALVFTLCIKLQSYLGRKNA